MGTGSDAWVVKIDATGTKPWVKVLVGSANEGARSILGLADGSYVVMGNSYSNDGDVSGNRGASDGWILKIKLP